MYECDCFDEEGTCEQLASKANLEMREFLCTVKVYNLQRHQQDVPLVIVCLDMSTKVPQAFTFTQLAFKVCVVKNSTVH